MRFHTICRRLAMVVTLLPLTITSTYALELEINDVKIHYEDVGTGDVVVFVHGAISDRRTWSQYRDVISIDRRFIAYDQRYFGKSQPPDADAEFSADSHADDLVGLIKALNSGPVSAVAWSYGGDVLARAAIERPDLFKALIYYEPDVNGLIENLPGASRATSKIFERFGPAMVALEEGRHSDAALHFAEVVLMLPDGGAASMPEATRTIWRDNSHTLPALLSAPAGDIATCEKISKVPIPTLVVMGSDGHTYDAMMAERIAECHPEAILAILQDANHGGPASKPSEFSEMIDDFLDLVTNK